jgi:hypothetical protein
MKRFFRKGEKTGVFAFGGNAMRQARLTLSTLEGAILCILTYKH